MLLMHENTPVAELEISLGRITQIKKILNPEHLPVGTNHEGVLQAKYLESWQKDRAIPFNRQSLDLYTNYFGTTALMAAQMSGSFSLTDHYWFKEKGNDDKWEDLCFQSNGISTDFAEFFLDMLTGKNPKGNGIPKLPDVNTDGVLPKMWIQDKNGAFSLVKFGEYGDYKDCNLLSANEVACSKIAKLMDIDAVPYEGIWLPGLNEPACKCENFVPSDMEFVTFAQIAKEHAGTQFDLYELIKEMGYKKEVEDMVRFYFLIHNKDGHTKNCGFLRNAKTLKIERFAPLFDHGCSLNYDKIGSADQSVKPFRATREEQIALVSNLKNMPKFEDMGEIIKDTYAQFSVPEPQLDFALRDLIETCNEWERLEEKDEREYE